MKNPIRLISRALLNYFVLCVGCLLAFPIGLAVVVLTLGLALPLTPWLIVDAIEIEVFRIPILLGGLVYLCLLSLTWRFQSSALATIRLSAISVALAFATFAFSAELKWRWAMEAAATQAGLDCIEVSSPIALRFRQANLAIHSDERMFYDPHATASRDGQLYIWSFGETDFVLKPNARGRCP